MTLNISLAYAATLVGAIGGLIIRPELQLLNQIPHVPLPFRMPYLKVLF